MNYAFCLLICKFLCFNPYSNIPLRFADMTFRAENLIQHETSTLSILFTISSTLFYQILEEIDDSESCDYVVKIK